MKVHYVSGSRADFGLMQRCLTALAQTTDFDVSVVVTGQHLLKHYGHTVDDITAAGLHVAARIPVRLDGAGGGEMAMAFAAEMQGFTSLWQGERPDLVLVLGDRGEMLAAALAAVHLGIHVAHIHGGERSGTLDESLRHAISKLAHVHFPATQDAATRLKRMGEDINAIHVIGAPGLVGLHDGIAPTDEWLHAHFDLPAHAPVALVVFHPVVQEADQAQAQINAVVDAVSAVGFGQIIMRPNSDSGGQGIDAYLDSIMGRSDITVLTHMPRDTYLKTLAACDVLVGNSSSGIIESASFDTPCLNIGSRQNDRLRNSNTIDCAHVTRSEIMQHLQQTIALRGPFQNLYGDGRTDRHLVEALRNLELKPADLDKRNCY